MRSGRLWFFGGAGFSRPEISCLLLAERVCQAAADEDVLANAAGPKPRAPIASIFYFLLESTQSRVGTPAGANKPINTPRKIASNASFQDITLGGHFPIILYS